MQRKYSVDEIVELIDVCRRFIRAQWPAWRLEDVFDELDADVIAQGIEACYKATHRSARKDDDLTLFGKILAFTVPGAPESPMVLLRDSRSSALLAGLRHVVNDDSIKLSATADLQEFWYLESDTTDSGGTDVAIAPALTQESHAEVSS
jgi:hypothetical protein